MVNQLKQTKTARTDELKLCNKREESGKIIIKIGHRGFVSVLAQIYRSIAKYGFRTLLRRVCTWRIMWLCHKLQISRLTHPFKVSCLRADYTLINLNNENFDGDPTRRHQERRNKRFAHYFHFLKSPLVIK